MGFNLDSLMGTYADFARAYLFYAKITSGVSGFPKDHPYLVQSTTLPAQTIEPITTNWQGNEYKIGGVNTFTDFTISFKSDAKQELRKKFLEWTKKIHDPVSNVHGNPTDYFGQVDLTQINTNGDPIMSYSLIKAFPTGVTEVSLGYETKEISTFDVTFAYQYHIADNIFDGGVGATEASV